MLRRRRRRQLNPRQRQGVLLMVIAAAGLIGVFVLIAGYVSNVSKQVGPKIDVLELTAPVPPYQPITPSMLGEVAVPGKWAPHNALRSPSEAVGLVTNVMLPAGTELEQGMLTTPPALQPGQREMAILVDAETGVAGQLTPGSEVDIIATFAGNNQGNKSSARVVVPDAKVLDVGTPTVGGGSATGSSGPAGQNQVVPVTFALSPQQVLAVSYAESFAQKVWLSLVAPGTGSGAAPPPYKPGL
jgi:pilus assembly protein CpaB